MAAYPLGSVVTKEAFTRNTDNVLVDPATITATIIAPDGTTAILVPTRVSVGAFEITYTPTQAGRHVVNWNASA